MALYVKYPPIVPRLKLDGVDGVKLLALEPAVEPEQVAFLNSCGGFSSFRIET